MNKKLRFLFLILFIIIAIAIIRYTSFDLMEIRLWVESFGMAAPFVFILIYIVGTIIFFPGTPLTITSGILFGKFFGTIYVVIGATIGATIAFFIAKYLGKDYFQSLIEKKKKLKKYNDKIDQNGFFATLFFRIVPLFPFNALNFMLGLTKIRTPHFFFGTMLGIIPGTFVLVYFGDSLTMQSYTNIIISVALFLILASIPFIYNHLKDRKTT